MKKLLFLSLCFGVLNGFGQTFTAQIDPPAMGKVCPNFTATLMGLGQSPDRQVSLASLRGQVVILDFWATYCGPCIPSLSHLDKLQKQFGNALAVLAISDEKRTTIEAFVQKRNLSSLHTVWDSTRVLNELFFHHFIPHTVVIDKNGVVRAFTTPDELDEDIIAKLVKNQPVNIALKPELQPTQAAKNKGQTGQKTIATPNQTAQVQLSFTGFQAGKESSFQKISPYEYLFTNCSLVLIYQVLYEQRENRLVLQADSSKYLDNPPLYCLHVRVPESSAQEASAAALAYLAQKASLKAMPIKAARQSLVLARLDSTLRSVNAASYVADKGFVLRDLINYIESNAHLINYLPVVNQTSLADSVLIDLDWFQNSSLELKQKLETLGLKAEERVVELPCLLLYEEKKVRKDG